MSSITGSQHVVGEAAERLEAAGGAVLRYGLVAILLYYGAFKFTAAEANGIQPLVGHSPILSWLLLGAALWSAAEALRAVRSRSPAS